MKNYPIFQLCLILISFAILSTSCNSNKYLSKTIDGKQTDSRLVGEWEGSEEGNQIKGMSKEWTMIRTIEGEFILDFKTTINGKTQQFIEKGTWWVIDGKFYELHENSGETDIYEYQILDEDKIKFKAFKLRLDQENQAYEFIDTRIKN